MTTHRVYTTPLPKKLGLAADMQVALIAAPNRFEETLGELPPNISFTTRLTPSTQLALCFIRSLSDLTATLDMLTVKLPKAAHVWLIYPKRAGSYKVDFNENNVRDAALKANLVDYKVCSVDSDWSGLKFAHRKP
jgi:Protein of unknown function (DUF3052)